MLQTISKARAKHDPVYFAKHLLRYDVHPYQAAALRDDHPTTVLTWGRGCGKTYVAIARALHCCYTTKNYVVVYIAGRMAQAKYAGDVALEMLQGTPLLNDITDQSSERIRLSNGSTIYFVPGGNPSAPRGFHNKLSREGEQPPGVLVVIDEAATVGRDTYVASQSILNTAPKDKGKFLVVGSPLGVNHWFFGEYMAGLDKQEKHTKSFHQPSTACPHILQDRLDEWREKMTPVEWGAEILAEFQEQLSSFFGGVIDPAVKQYTTPLPHDVQCSYHLGVDLSTSARAGSDYTVFVVVERWWGGVKQVITPLHGDLIQIEHKEVKPYARIADIRRYQILTFEQLRNELRDIKKQYPSITGLTVEWYESTQLEAICRDDLWMQVERLHPTNALQREVFPFVHGSFRDGILELPQDGPNVRQLLKELKALSYKITDAGNITYSAIEGEKDDVVYALAWGLWGSRVHTPPMEVVG